MLMVVRVRRIWRCADGGAGEKEMEIMVVAGVTMLAVEMMAIVG
jgi:hypothetical protein